MIVYTDTSFLFSLYVPDANSAAAAAIIKGIKPPLVATDFAEFEFINALNAGIFRKELRPSEVRAVLVAFSKDARDGLLRIVPISAASFGHARRIAGTQTRLLGSRAMDVLHVGSALALRASSFCTFDKNQARLATAVGLRVP